MFVGRLETRSWFLAFALVTAACGGSSPSGGGGHSGKGGAGVGVGGAAAGTGGSGGGLGGAKATGGAPAGGAGRGGGGAGGTLASGGSPGTAGAGGKPVGPANNSLAKACTADVDCGTGLVCLKATDKLILNSAGPANGYCTMKCATQADATACEAAGGLCLDLSEASDGSVGYCLQNCKFGDMDQASKCQGRFDQACAQVYDSNDAVAGAVCLPLCVGDTDCPTGRKCDPSEGVCVDTAHTGDPMGAHCTADPDTGASACAGYCQGIGDANNNLIASFCTQRCVLGAPGGCGIVGPGTSVTGGTHGACAYGADPTAARGDLGFCTVECDTVTDCPDKTDPNPVCDATETMSAIGHGICTWN
jgi:hypothetical protein